MQKIILFYKFTPINDTKAILLWQKSLATQYNLKGRIIIADHGINGTLAGNIDDLKKYIKEFKTYPNFKKTVFKWSEGNQADFPRLSVKVRPEIVSFGVANKIKVNGQGIIGGGQHLKPEEVNDLVKKHGNDVIFFDGRNKFEASIGRFKDAIIPQVEHSRDFPKELKNKKYEKIKDKPIVTYCTGGVRCEVITKLMKDEGFKEVYQIDGGIVKYGEKYKDKGLWEGKLFVFDKRMDIKFSDQAKDIARCTNCNSKTSNYENCLNKSCNKLILLCIQCARDNKLYCQNCKLAIAV